MEAPRTLQEAITFFADADTCLKFFAAERWPDGVICPTCGSKEVKFIPTRRLWECKHKHTRKQFSIKAGTLFEDSPLGLDKWFPAVWLITSAINDVSSCELARSLGVTQPPLGSCRNMHISKRQRRITGTGTKDKVAVMGILERGGEVRTAVVPSRKKAVLQPEVRKHVEAGAALYTDFLLSYEGLAFDYAHKVVDHAVEYVNGRVHTNGLENFWSLLKRGIGGTYISIEPFICSATSMSEPSTTAA